jgi:hypothetical protein
MGHSDLYYDPVRDLFSLALTVIVRDEEEPRMGNAEMYIDTGSNRTFLAEDKAVEMGLRLGGRLTEMVGGIAGIGGAPILKKVDIIFPDTTLITLPQILVMRPPKRTDRTHRGGLARERNLVSDPVSLLGLDAVRKLRGQLSFDLSSDDPKASLDWG